MGPEPKPFGEHAILRDLREPALPGRAVLFLRHAEREEIDPRIPNHDVLLTARGIADARGLGARLPASHRLLLTHTRFRRTRQTAEALAEGFAAAGGRPVPPRQLHSRLGSYVLSDDLFRIAYTPRFLPDWISGKIPPGLILGPSEAAKMLLRRVLDPSTGDCPVPADGDLYVHVAHDWDVSALRWALFGIRFEDAPPGFLEGIILAPGDGWVEARCLGRHANVPDSWLKE
jgi:hypothetical protein